MNAERIPVNTKSYNKATLATYKLMFFSKYTALVILIWSPMYFVLDYFIPWKDALLISASSLAFVMVLFPPLFCYLFYFMALRSPKAGLLKVGILKDIE